MLGEGFDLPELKIAALHDPHKSLGITLQFTGRFTRTKATIGDATIIANIADTEVGETLKNLYAEDANWNILLRNSSSDTIRKQIEIVEFVEGFSSDFLAEMPIRNKFPKMSTQVFETNASVWNPHKFHSYFKQSHEIFHAIHSTTNILVIIEKVTSPVGWGAVKEINNISWEIYIAYRNQEKNLLFINSTVSGQHQKLAEAIISNPQQIKGERVYNSFSGIKRLVLQNVGLNDAYGGHISFRMYTGTDVQEGLSDSHKKNSFKSNVFGLGFEDGGKTSIGCSYKGKIWSRKISNIIEWVEWCNKIGDKILDPKINPDNILHGVLISKRIDSRPQKIPLTIEWPNSFAQDNETNIDFIFDKVPIPLYAVSIDLLEHNEKGPIKFKIHHDSIEATFELNIEDSGYSYVPLKDDIYIVKGNNKKKLSDLFYDDGPVIRFSDGSYMMNQILVEAQSETQSASPFIYDKQKIKTMPWTGVDIKKESQKNEKRTDSIQYYIIQQLKNGNYDIIFDDDSSGEAADIITIKVQDERVLVEFYHWRIQKFYF